MTSDVSDNLGGITAANPVVARPYAVALFDVLGFKKKFEELGLMEITARYRALIDIVVKQNEHLMFLKSIMPNLQEGPYWCADEKMIVVTRVHAAYASDTFLVWANYTWTELYKRSKEELERLSEDPNHDWLFRPIPCDSFLETCNELICRSLQVGLPLRGALAVGDAIMDKERNIFLGQPIIDTNLLEREQKFIGAGMCSSFVGQTIPKHFSLPFSRQMKRPYADFSGTVLDWPRHWRNTRPFDVKPFIEAVNSDSSSSSYYENTFSLIEESEKVPADADEDFRSVRKNYEQFSYSRGGNIAGYVMPVRRVTPEETAALLRDGKFPMRRTKKQKPNTRK